MKNSEYLCMDTYLEKTGDDSWVVKRPIPYLFEGVSAVIPVGFETDICSHVPNCDWWYACVVHDWLYTLGDYVVGWKQRYRWRKEADRKLSRLMQLVSRNFLKNFWAGIYFLGVRLFGAPVFWEANESSRKLAENFAHLHPEFRSISIWAEKKEES